MLCVCAPHTCPQTHYNSERCKLETGNYVHGLELLEEKLACIGDLDVCHILTAFAILAPPLIAQQPTALSKPAASISITPLRNESRESREQRRGYLADVDLESVGGKHETFHEEHRGTIADQAVPFHLTQAQPTISRSTFCWLPCKHCSWTLIITTPLQTIIRTQITNHERLSALTELIPWP